MVPSERRAKCRAQGAWKEGDSSRVGLKFWAQGLGHKFSRFSVGSWHHQSVPL